MELDYAAGVSLELVDAVPAPVETFNSLSTVPLEEFFITTHPVFPDWYSYKEVFEFTLYDEKGSSRVLMWDGHSEVFRVPGQHRDFYLHLMAQSLLSVYGDSVTCAVDLRETEVVDGVRKETEWGWRLFTYRKCAVRPNESRLLLVTRAEEATEAVSEDDEVVTFLGERVSGYDVVHSMTSEDYTELTRAVFGVKREPYREWESFLELATGDHLVVMDGDYSRRGDVLSRLGGVRE